MIEGARDGRGGSRCYGITISANVIAHDFGGGIDLRDAWGCAISANTVTICGRFGIRVGPDSGRLAISANTFSDSNIGGKTRRTTPDPATGLVLEGTTDIAVTGNVFSGLQTAPVASDEACRRVTMVGNAIVDCRTADETRRRRAGRRACDRQQRRRSVMRDS